MFLTYFFMFCLHLLYMILHVYTCPLEFCYTVFTFAYIFIHVLHIFGPPTANSIIILLRPLRDYFDLWARRGIAQRRPEFTLRLTADPGKPLNPFRNTSASVINQWKP